MGAYDTPLLISFLFLLTLMYHNMYMGHADALVLNGA